ncbi:hypothetical protein K0M31_002941 [Melipona bicolor]|uniref:Uncharacterized protein n=1 Tax=Melipona bicolor TaxID=60889 RepID=A0AA40FZV4_9HYME|nr:hypothetical protein K0M31_002941 [Melipona bicolor]
MNDTQNQNNFDFIPKSDYNEKWHLENKCLFHNQQFLEGDKCETNKLACPVSCDLCLHFREKYKSKRSGSILNQKSGDWKSDENIVKNSLERIVQEPSITEWRWKNPYSVSDFDRSKRWSRRNFTSGDDFTTNLLRDLCNKENRYKNPVKDDTKKNFLYNFHEYLVNYQESCGVPRTEYSFSTLINTMGRATGQSLLALLYVMLNVIPVIEFLVRQRLIVSAKKTGRRPCATFIQRPQEESYEEENKTSIPINATETRYRSKEETYRSAIVGHFVRVSEQLI